MITRVNKEIENVFSPSTPINMPENFVGRYKDLKVIQQAIFQKGQHLLLFGERGVGKTSLANILFEKLQQNQHKVRVHRTSAIYDTNFDKIWQNILNEVKDEKIRKTYISRGGDSNKIDIRALLSIFSKTWHPTLFIIDEFDLLAKKKENCEKFALLIKALSDSCSHITLLIIGVANKAGELIDQHPSLERCLVEYHLEKMTRDDMADLIEIGGKNAGFRFQSAVVDMIIEHSSGYPYFAHLLSQYSCKHAKKLHYSVVTPSNFNEGLKMALSSARTQFEKQTRWARSRNNDNYLKLLEFGMKNEEQEIELNDFSKALDIPVEKRKSRLSYYLSQLTKAGHGGILEKDKNKKTYRFKSPLLRAYLKEELLSKNSEPPSVSSKTKNSENKVPKSRRSQWDQKTDESLSLLD